MVREKPGWQWAHIFVSANTAQPVLIPRARRERKTIGIRDDLTMMITTNIITTQNYGITYSINLQGISPQQPCDSMITQISCLLASDSPIKNQEPTPLNNAACSLSVLPSAATASPPSQPLTAHRLKYSAIEAPTVQHFLQEKPSAQPGLYQWVFLSDFWLGRWPIVRGAKRVCEVRISLASSWDSVLRRYLVGLGSCLLILSLRCRQRMARIFWRWWDRIYRLPWGSSHLWMLGILCGQTQIIEGRFYCWRWYRHSRGWFVGSCLVGLKWGKCNDRPDFCDNG